jgi:hypothetical protein
VLAQELHCLVHGNHRGAIHASQLLQHQLNLQQGYDGTGGFVLRDWGEMD